MSKKSKKGKHHHHHQHQQESQLSTSDQQKLSAKLQNIFDKQVLTEYENENYRECIKQCDRILQIYPKNGETLAMKGLCLHCQGCDDKEKDDDNDGGQGGHHGHGQDDDDKEELKRDGMQFIDNGLKYNLKSSICWRVKGLAHRSDLDYEMAIKCFKKSLQIDKQNQRILTDLSSLQIQLKKFDDFVQTRYQLWLLNQDKLNCIAYFVALFLNKQYEQCQTFINENIENESNKFKLNTDLVELNEIYLLQTNILLKQEKYSECLTFLKEKLDKKAILDKLKALQIRLNIEMKLKKYDDATKTVLNLIDQNPENLNYHNQYKQLLQLLDEKDLYQVYTKFAEQYPKCKTIKRLLLECCDDTQFKVLLNEYLMHGFKKSVLSLYNDLRNLYKNKSKGLILNELIDSYRNELATNYRFNMDDDKHSASPMCLLWVNYFYCSHLIDTNKFDLCLKILDETIQIVPTCIELYVLKGKLYKNVGNNSLAFKYLDIARKLDKADRYLNTKCVRYAFRTFKIDDAEKMVNLFLKKSEGTKSLQNLQVIWYQLNKAEAHLKLKQFGPAIKQYENIYLHFETFWKNQTDFHRYSYRKCAITSYLQLLEWEYNLRNHPIFIRAARKAIALWIKIYILQKQKKTEILTFGSSKQSDLDKKMHRQNDERGWNLIHCKYPLNKANNWLNHLLPFMDDINEENRIYIYSLYIKYLFHIKDYKQCIENINIVNTKHSQLSNHPYFIYTLYTILYDEDDSNDDDDDEMNKIKTEKYNMQFLKHYYQENLTNFDSLLFIFKLCAEHKQIEIALTEIIDAVIKLECSPLQCVQIREELAKHLEKNVNDDGLLQKFEKYVDSEYPLQMKVENDIM